MFDKNLLPQNFTVTYHAGALNTKDNTLESVKTALDANADILEVDVSFLPDLTPVLIHDAAPTDPTLPTLESAFELISKYERTMVNLDMKSVAAMKKVQLLAQKYGLLQRVFFTGISYEWAKVVRADTTISYYLNETVPKLKGDAMQNYTEKLIAKIREAGAVGLNAWYGTVEKSLIDCLRKEGMAISLWTVNTEEAMVSVLSRYPDNITTLHPDLLIKLLNG